MNEYYYTFRLLCMKNIFNRNLFKFIGVINIILKYAYKYLSFNTIFLNI